jgi:hypothetical protein
MYEILEFADDLPMQMLVMLNNSAPDPCNVEYIPKNMKGFCIIYTMGSLANQVPGPCQGTGAFRIDKPKVAYIHV